MPPTRGAAASGGGRAPGVLGAFLRTINNRADSPTLGLTRATGTMRGGEESGSDDDAWAAGSGGGSLPAARAGASRPTPH
jgi:hypothetical protein